MQLNDLVESLLQHIFDQTDMGCLLCKDSDMIGICMQAWKDNLDQHGIQVLQPKQLQKNK